MNQYFLLISIYIFRLNQLLYYFKVIIILILYICFNNIKRRSFKQTYLYINTIKLTNYETK